MIDTQAILDERRQDGDMILCRHPEKARYPYKAGWEICAECGEIVRPLDFIPVWETDFMNYMEETK